MVHGQQWISQAVQHIETSSLFQHQDAWPTANQLEVKLSKNSKKARDNLKQQPGFENSDNATSPSYVPKKEQRSCHVAINPEFVRKLEEIEDA